MSDQKTMQSAREGADVAMVHLPEEEEDARETERWVRDTGRKFARYGIDIRSEQHCERLIQQTKQAVPGRDSRDAGRRLHY